MISVAFFNNKGGVGKTALIYHLAWTYTDLGLRVLVADLDPQSNLTALCLEDGLLEELWETDDEDRQTIYGAVYPVKEEMGDIKDITIEPVSPKLGLITGDIKLSQFEAKLSDVWPRCLDGGAPAYRATTAIHRVVRACAEEWEADLVLLDVGPNLGAINRSALLAAEWVTTPLGADLFSIQGLRNLGPTLAQWRKEWRDRLEKNPINGLDMPGGSMKPAGYVITQPNLYGGRVTKAYQKWIARVPTEYAHTLPSPPKRIPASTDQDPYCLGIMKHYRSLMPLAHEVRKPVFHLTAADGALGAHATAAREAGGDFKGLAERLAQQIKLRLPRRAA